MKKARFALHVIAGLWVIQLGSFALTRPAAWAASAEVERINHAIMQERAEWSAADNKFSRLDPSERRSRAGVLLPKAMPGDRFYQPPAARLAPGALPSYFNWADQGGVKWVTPPKDQGSCNSCWAFGNVAAFESAIHIAEDRPVLPNDTIDLSEQFMVDCSAGHCDFWYTNQAANFLVDPGVPYESFRGYQGTVGTCNYQQPELFRELISLDGWSWVTTDTADVATLKAAVYERPIGVGMKICDDFEVYDTGVYKHVLGGCGEELFKRGHFVLLVGWNDADESWIVKNSWGDDWGENGYFRIKWSESANAFGTWSIMPHYTARRADFYNNISVGTAPLTVRFTDRSNGNPISWNWEFGEGGTSADKYPSHTYIKPGTYTVTLNTVWFDYRASISKTGIITVLPPSCDDNNPCTTDVYNGDTGDCKHYALSGNACNADADGCTVGDSCKNGVCLPGPAVDCSDVCNEGSCHSVTSTSYECKKNPLPKEGLPCDADGNGCTQDDRCTNGSCTPGATVDCSALDETCKSGVCVSKSANEYECQAQGAPKNGAACDDLNACTQNDLCRDGVCVAKETPACPTPDDCHQSGACDPTSGACADATPKADWSACAQGDLAPHACFGLRCEPLAENDTCPSATELHANVTLDQSIDGHHAFGPPSACQQDAYGPDAFFVYLAESSQPFTVHAQSKDGLDLALALYTGCNPDAICLLFANQNSNPDGEEIVHVDRGTPLPLIIRVVALGEAPSGDYSIRVEVAAPDGDAEREADAEHEAEAEGEVRDGDDEAPQADGDEADAQDVDTHETDVAEHESDTDGADVAELDADTDSVVPDGDVPEKSGHGGGCRTGAASDVTGMILVLLSLGLLRRRAVSPN